MDKVFMVGFIYPLGTKKLEFFSNFREPMT